MTSTERESATAEQLRKKCVKSWEESPVHSEDMHAVNSLDMWNQNRTGNALVSIATW